MFSQDSVLRIRCENRQGGSNASGYLLDLRHALTVSHVLKRLAVGGSCSVTQLTSNHWQPAQMKWQDEGSDLALLELLETAATGSEIEPMVGEASGHHPIPWHAVGFPNAKQAEHAWGFTSAISAADAGQLALTVDSRHARQRSDGSSGWVGLSGAGVFSGEHLIGVVTRDPGAYEHSLTAARMSRLAEDKSFCAALGREFTSLPFGERTETAQASAGSSKLIHSSRQTRHLRIYDEGDYVDLRTDYKGTLFPTVETFINGELSDSFRLSNRVKYHRKFTASTRRGTRTLSLMFQFPKAALDINPKRKLSRLEVYLDGTLVYLDL